MKRRHRLLDVALLSLVALTAWRYVDRALSAEQPETLTIGARLTLPGYAFSSATRHVILMMSRDCYAVNEGTHFYESLAQRVARTPGVRLTIVAAEPADEVRQWLRSHDVVGAQIVKVDSLSSLGISFTPTLVIANGEGRITDFAAGALFASQEAQMFARIEHAASTAAVAINAPPRQVRSPNDVSNGQVLDIRERTEFAGEHFTGAVNIPIDEVIVRAPVELDRSRAVAIDCRKDRNLCNAVGVQLRSLGFVDIAIASN